MSIETAGICEALRQRQSVLTQHHGDVRFVSDDRANRLLNDLEKHPHAFVLACLMDRQQKAERCWMIPYVVQRRLGTFEFEDLAGLPRERVIEVMSSPEPLHRFTDIMARVFYGAIQHIAKQYSGNASRIWAGNLSSATIVKRFLEFDGAGPKIATMAANTLVRDFKIAVSDKISIDISVDAHVHRVF
ncbi:MAG: iron-sulfur cluster loop, partial [Chloroflexota bacterium]